MPIYDTFNDVMIDRNNDNESRFDSVTIMTIAIKAIVMK